MDLKKRKENYKIGLYYVVFVILFPLFSILIMELMTIIIVTILFSALTRMFPKPTFAP